MTKTSDLPEDGLKKGRGEIVRERDAAELSGAEKERGS